MNALDVLPSILDLGRHHQAIGDGFSKISAEKAAGVSEAAEISAVANDIFLERDEAIIGLILTMPAATLGDVAVQLQAALANLDGAYEDDGPEDARALARRLRRVLVSAAVVTGRDAGVDPAMMGFASLADIHRGEFPPALLGGVGGATTDPAEISEDLPENLKPAEGPDAELITLCGQLLDVVARQEALFAERADIVDRIEEMPNPKTTQGRAALAIAERNKDGEIPHRTKGARLAWMAVKSLTPGGPTV